MKYVKNELMRLLLLLYLLVPFETAGQAITAQAWTRLSPLFASDDTSGIEVIITEEKVPRDQLALLSILGCRPKIADKCLTRIPVYQMHEPGGGNDSGSYLPMFVLVTANVEMAKIFKHHGWNFSEHAVMIAASCNWEEALELIDELLPAGFDRYLCALSNDSGYKKMLDWLLTEGYSYNFDYFFEHFESANPQSKRMLAYLLSKTVGEQYDQHRLLIAVYNSDAATLARLIKEDRAPIHDLPNNVSLLHYPIVHEDTASLRLLLEAGADPNWINSDSTGSVLMDAVLQGNPLIFDMLAPRLRSVNILHDDRRNVLHYLAAYPRAFNRSLIPGNRTDSQHYKPGHYNILQKLVIRGIDFNRTDRSANAPLEFLSVSGDSLWARIALEFIRNTFNQSALQSFTSRHLQKRVNEQVLQALVGQIDDPEYVLSIANDSLVQPVTAWLTELPTVQFWGTLLQRYIRTTNATMARWILMEIPRRLTVNNPELSRDSIRSAIVNVYTKNSYNREGHNALMLLVKSYDHSPAYSQLARAIIHANPDFSRLNEDNMNVFDLLNRQVNIQASLYKYLQVPMLKKQALNFSEKAVLVRDAVTGETLRKTIFEYRKKLFWYIDQKSCFSCRGTGRYIKNNGQDNWIEVQDFGNVNFGPFPKNACNQLSDVRFPRQPRTSDPESLRMLYKIYADIDTAGTYYPSYKDHKLVPNFNKFSFYLNAWIGLQETTFKCEGTYKIPAALFNNDNLTDLPAVKITATSDIINIEQNGSSILLNPNKDTILDRTLGEIVIKYGTTDNDKHSRVGFEIEANRQYTDINDLLVPTGSDEQRRFATYLEICRQQSYLQDTSLSNIDRKTIEVTIHILSEYAMQRGYYARAREEYANILQRLQNLGAAKLALNDFYRTHTSLTKENIPILIGELDQLLQSTDLTRQQKRRFTNYRSQLQKASTNADLSAAYTNIFNDELNVIIEDQLSDYQRYTLELIQYIGLEVLRSDRAQQLLMERPLEFKQKYGPTLARSIQNSAIQ